MSRPFPKLARRGFKALTLARVNEMVAALAAAEQALDEIPMAEHPTEDDRRLYRTWRKLEKEARLVIGPHRMTILELARWALEQREPPT